MSKIFLNMSAVILLLLGSATTGFSGRADKAGTASAAELLIPVGARSIGLGGSMLATIHGIESIYWNPAGLSPLITDHSVMFSHMIYLADIDVEYVAAATKLSSFGDLGISLKSLNFGNINITTEDYPDGTGETTSPTFITLGGTFARQISDHISVGVTAKLIYEKMARVSSSTVGFDLGVQYDGIGGIDGLSVGATVKNIGPAMRFDGDGLFRQARISDAVNSNSIVKIQAAAADLPSTIEVGIGYVTAIEDIGKFTLNSTFQNNNYSADEYKFGAEYSYNNLFAVRSGIAIASEGGTGRYIFGPSFGLGVNYQLSDLHFSFDYAYRIVEFFAGNQVFSLIIDF